MALFRRILNFTPEVAQRREKRHASRYPVPADTPIRTTLVANGAAGIARLLNLSSGGCNLATTTKPSLEIGATVRVDLALADETLAIPARVAHVKATAEEQTYGLVFSFPDFAAKKAYLQLLEPVAIGMGLNPTATPARESEPGFNTNRYLGTEETLLTVWRENSNDHVTGFELRMNDYYVRNGPDHSLLVYVSRDDDAASYGGAELTRAGEEATEVRQLFRWATAHLNPDLPTDVRASLQACA